MNLLRLAIQRKRIFLFCLVAIYSVAVLISLVYSWLILSKDQVTCTHSVEVPLASNNGYLEIQLLAQHPIEPVFDGKLFVYSTDNRDSYPSSLTVVRSSVGTYGKGTHNVGMVLDQENQAFRTDRFYDISLVSEKGLHRSFPFDSAHFNFDIDLDPPIGFQFVRIVNRVPGFVVDCQEVSVVRPEKGKVTYGFTVDRSPLITLTSIVLVITATFFVVMIGFINSIQTLALTAASFFFSIWSLRGILSAEIQTFPTLFDASLLSLSVILLVILSWKVLMLSPNKMEQFTDQGQQ